MATGKVTRPSRPKTQPNPVDMRAAARKATMSSGMKARPRAAESAEEARAYETNAEYRRQFQEYAGLSDPHVPSRKLQNVYLRSNLRISRNSDWNKKGK